MTDEYDDFKFHENLNHCVYAYTVYGKQIVMDDSGTVFGSTAFNNFYGYTGRYLDSETGLWYFRARYFSDEMGRFISRDPLGYVDGMSLYNAYFASLFILDSFGLDGFCLSFFSIDEICGLRITNFKLNHTHPIIS